LVSKDIKKNLMYQMGVKYFWSQMGVQNILGVKWV